MITIFVKYAVHMYVKLWQIDTTVLCEYNIGKCGILQLYDKFNIDGDIHVLRRS